MSYRWRSAGAQLGAQVVVGVLVLASAAVAQITQETVTPVSATTESTVDRLRQLSIEELGALKVTSVEKRPEALSNAPAAIFVITHDDIIRSGAVSLPEILRIAPNLQVYQQGAGQWVVTSRGFAGNNAFQSFSNLMLVLIDGRSIYNPVFTGINWDMQDLVPDNIDSIEVISGPAGTLWGANAVQGVVNIITRNATETQGALVDVVTGSHTRALTAQVGGRIGETLAFRLFARDVTFYDTQTATGGRAYDSVRRAMGGFRADWTPTQADSISLRGDYAEGADEYEAYRTIPTSSRDVALRWNHAWSADSTLGLLAYYDRQAHGWDPQGDPYLSTPTTSKGRRRSTSERGITSSSERGSGDTRTRWETPRSSGPPATATSM